MRFLNADRPIRGLAILKHKEIAKERLRTLKIGMFPEISLDRFEQVGNAAGVGAKMMLVSKRFREKAREIARRIEYVELTVVNDFANRFAYSLLF